MSYRIVKDNEGTSQYSGVWIYGYGDEMPPGAHPGGVLFNRLDQEKLYRFNARSSEWVDIDFPAFNVLSYGAKTSAAADHNTERFQAAIDDAWTVGGAVLLPALSFNIGNLILPTGSSDDTDRSLSIIGQSDNTGGEPKTARRRYGSRLLFAKTDGSDCMAAITPGGTWPKYHFAGFTIEGPDSEATALSGNGIRVTGGSSARVTIRNVELTHFRGAAGFRLGTCLGSLIENAFAQYCKYGFYLDATFNGNTIINPYAQACTDVGMFIADAASATIIGGIIQSGLKTGIYMEAVSGVRLLNTYFENNNSSDTADEYALKVDAPSSGRGSTHIKLDGCRFSDVRDKVYLSGVSGGTVTATTIEGGYNSPVADPKIILNNEFVNNTRLIEVGAPGASVTDNGSNTRYEHAGETYLPALLSTKASVAGSAGVRLPHGTAPTNPTDGDHWTTSAGAFYRIGGVTRQVAFV